MHQKIKELAVNALKLQNKDAMDKALQEIVGICEFLSCDDAKDEMLDFKIVPSKDFTDGVYDIKITEDAVHFDGADIGFPFEPSDACNGTFEKYLKKDSELFAKDADLAGIEKIGGAE